MPSQTQVAKWGNSLAVRIPHATVREAGLAEGDRLSIDLAGDGAIVLRSSRRKYSLDQLVKGITRKNRHPETDWGPPRGKESW
jgi:antitoxin MazE